MQLVEIDTLQSLENKILENKSKIERIEAVLAQGCLSTRRRASLEDEKANLMAENIEFRRGQNLIRQSANSKLIILLLYFCFY